MNEFVSILALILLLSAGLYFRYKEYKKLKAYFNNALIELNMEEPTAWYRYKHSYVAIDSETDRIALIRLNKNSIVKYFETHYVCVTPNNKSVLVFDERNFRFCVIKSGETFQVYNILDILEVEIEEVPTVHPPPKIDRIQLRILVNDTAHPNYRFNFLSHSVEKGSTTYNQILSEVEDLKGRFMILWQQAYAISQANEHVASKGMIITGNINQVNYVENGNVHSVQNNNGL